MKYMVLRSLTHNGKVYGPGTLGGSFIDLNPDEAAPLLPRSDGHGDGHGPGTIVPLPDTMLSADEGATYHCKGPMVTVDGGKTFDCAGCGVSGISSTFDAGILATHNGTPVEDRTPDAAASFGTPLFAGRPMVTTDGGKTFHCAGPVVTANNGSTHVCETCKNNMSSASPRDVIDAHQGTPVVDQTPASLKNSSAFVPAANAQAAADRAQSTADKAQATAFDTGTQADQSKANAAQDSADEAQAKAKPSRLK